MNLVWQRLLHAIMTVVIVVHCLRLTSSSSTMQCNQDCTSGRPSWLKPYGSRDLQLVIGGLVAKSGHGAEMESLRFTSNLWSAVNIAKTDIKKDTCVLKGYDLHIEDNDTQCKAANGMKILFDTMSSKVTPHLALLGAACTSVNEPVAKTAKYFKVVQLSYAEAHPKFTSAKDSYSFFYSVVPTVRSIHTAEVHLLHHYNWSRVGIVVQRDDTRYALPQEEAQNALVAKHSIKVDVSVGFSATKFNIREELEDIRKKDVRIILGFFNSSIAAEVFCEAYKMNLTGPMYSWILSGFVDENWWQTSSSNCSTAQLSDILNGHFMLSFSVLRSDKIKTINGKSADQFQNQFFNNCRSEDCADFKYYGYIYDGVWTLALALEKLVVELSCSNGKKFNPEIDYQLIQEEWGERLLDKLNETDFEGVTGKVRFEENQRLGLIRIAQFQNGTYASVGEYDAANERFYITDDLVYWPNGQRPADQIFYKTEERYIDFAVFCIMSALTVVGIVAAVWFLVVNFYFRNHRFIKMSSPNMNNLIVAGSILTYLSVVLIGLDTRMISKNSFGIVCTAKVWTLCFGFTLAFGSMFSKTWRVHSIFTNIKLNKKAIKDYKLFMIVLILLLIDLIILSVWLLIERMEWKDKSLANETYLEKNLKIEPKIEYCYSDYSIVFQVLLFAVKGIQLVTGCFLAWETRHVNVPALNDSKYIGACVYNVVVMCALGVPCSFILQENVNASYILISIFIIFCTTLTLCLVFIPKVVELARNPKGGPPDRRFRQTMMKSSNSGPDRNISTGSVEDQRERMMRAEQDNLVWKKMLDDRIAELNTVIKQLEEAGERVSSEKTRDRSSSKQKPTAEDDPYGGVFLGFGPPPELSQKEEAILASPQTPLVEEATEKTSLLPRTQSSLKEKKENHQTMRLPSFKKSASSNVKPLSSPTDGDQCGSAYQSVTEMDEMSVDSYQMNYQPNSTAPYTKLRYIDSLLSDECISSSRTMPSIKESCLGTFSSFFSLSSRQNSFNHSYDSTTSRINEEGDEYKSACGSFIFSNVFGGSTSWDSAESDVENDYVMTENTWLTPTEDTVTSSIMDNLENQSLLTENETGKLHVGYETMSSSSSTQSISQYRRQETQKTKKDLRWYEKLMHKYFGSPEKLKTTNRTTNYERLPRKDSRPVVPQHLLEYQGPECPFVVRTKDFQLYTKFTLDKVIDEEP